MKFIGILQDTLLCLSRPVWGAWIEIEDNYDLISCDNVAPRMGRVD